VQGATDSDILLAALYVLGGGFLLINLHQFYQYLKFRRLRPTALLTWAPQVPSLYRLFTWVGAVLAILVFYKIAVLRLHPKYVFGETMMLVYYVYALPLRVKIARGFYEDGIWADAGFIPYANIGGLTWRDGEPPTLVMLYRWRTFARKLIVPEPYYGQARRLLRDKIAAHDIHFTGKTLDLGAHDERDDV
jgi:hypothetical protein